MRASRTLTHVGHTLGGRMRAAGSRRRRGAPRRNPRRAALESRAPPCLRQEARLRAARCALNARALPPQESGLPQAPRALTAGDVRQPDHRAAMEHGRTSRGDQLLCA
eukprot:5091627-Prymnesium_polylepis.1